MRRFSPQVTKRRFFMCARIGVRLAYCDLNDLAFQCVEHLLRVDLQVHVVF